jgi:hypothetical protein
MKGVLMPRLRNIPVFQVVCALFCLLPTANTPSSQDEHAAFWQVVQTVREILAGQNVVQTTDAIAPGARLIDGVRFEDLRSVVAGENKNCSLADTAFHGVMIQGRTNPAEDMGFLILKTVTYDNTRVRFHSIVFLKDSTGQFKIQIWHTGDQANRL